MNNQQGLSAYGQAILSYLEQLITGNQPQMQTAANLPPIQYGQHPVQSPPPMVSSQQAIIGQQGPNPSFRFQMGLKDYSFTKPQIQAIMKAKGSPLARMTDEFIKAGEKYGVDPRILVTIANNESTLGKRYPAESYNPFGYTVNTPQVPQDATGIQKEQAIWQGLRNAGFTSLPMAIDRLTARFSATPYNTPPNQGAYQNFRQNPTIENLQAAYNANPQEGAAWINNGNEAAQYFQQQQQASVPAQVAQSQKLGLLGGPTANVAGDKYEVATTPGVGFGTGGNPLANFS